MKNQSVSVSRLDQPIVHLLHRAGQVADEMFASEIAADITPRQYAVLSTLAKYQTATQIQIVNDTGIDRSTVAEIVKRLLRRGVITRRRAKEDARAYAVSLTPTGQTLLRQVEPAVQRVDQRLLKRMSATQRREFVEALSTIGNGR
jgi:DNA-binding MarR family transcriptional regulator